MRITLFILFLAAASVVVGQKRLSEGSLSYSVLTYKHQQVIGDSLNAQHFFKGAHTRTELSGSIGRTITLYDSREETGAILREFGGQKILIPLDAAAWADKNAWYSPDSIQYTNEEQTLLNYPCKRAQINLRSGAMLRVWFTPSIILDNKDTEFQLGDLPGLVLAYEYENEGTLIRYTINSLNFDPVPIQKFDIPNSGFRILNYAESKKQF
jgi:GLPGLI family protein